MSGSAPMAGQPFPRGILFAVGGMLAVVTLVAGLGRMQGSHTEVPQSTPVAVLDLSFQDRPDGGISVLDQDGHLVRVVNGEAGFLRATLRGLAQQRLREDLGAAEPFRITKWADGRLTLDDPATRRHIELEAFGATNEAVFADLLGASSKTPAGR